MDRRDRWIGVCNECRALGRRQRAGPRHEPRVPHGLAGADHRCLSDVQSVGDRVRRLRAHRGGRRRDRGRGGALPCRPRSAGRVVRGQGRTGRSASGRLRARRTARRRKPGSRRICPTVARLDQHAVRNPCDGADRRGPRRPRTHRHAPDSRRLRRLTEFARGRPLGGPVRVCRLHRGGGVGVGRHAAGSRLGRLLLPRCERSGCGAVQPSRGTDRVRSVGSGMSPSNGSSSGEHRAPRWRVTPTTSISSWSAHGVMAPSVRRCSGRFPRGSSITSTARSSSCRSPIRHPRRRRGAATRQLPRVVVRRGSTGGPRRATMAP